MFILFAKFPFYCDLDAKWSVFYSLEDILYCIFIFCFLWYNSQDLYNTEWLHIIKLRITFREIVVEYHASLTTFLALPFLPLIASSFAWLVCWNLGIFFSCLSLYIIQNIEVEKGIDPFSATQPCINPFMLEEKEDRLMKILFFFENAPISEIKHMSLHLCFCGLSSSDCCWEVILRSL